MVVLGYVVSHFSPVVIPSTDEVIYLALMELVERDDLGEE